ncbi:MAG: fibronectin type III domain-containing protein [Bacteroidales bacterium]|nr:fibronectin type III domain-containing protein [Bacteroidales bacterium]
MRNIIRFAVPMLMTFLVCATNIHAQGLEDYWFATGDDGSLLSPSSFAELISSGNDDRSSAVTDIGFTFVYDGVEYTQFSVSSNGRMRLGGNIISTDYHKPFISSYYTDNAPVIVAVGRDCSTGAAGYVKTGLYNDGSQTIRVIECLLNTSSNTSGTDYIKFQFQLCQGSNEVTIVYGSGNTSAPVDYQIGIGNASADKFWYVNPSEHTALYSTTYNNETYYVHPGAGRYYSFRGPLVSYVCDFENSDENSNWILVNDSQTNYWMIGNATSSSGSNSLYITNDDLSNAYTIDDNWSDVYAYRHIYFPLAGDYVVSFKWKGLGESGYDYMRAFLVPASMTLTSGNAYDIDVNNVPAGWIAVDGSNQLNQNSNWSEISNMVTVSEAGEYNLVFYWRNDNSYGTPPPAAVDDVRVSEPCEATASLSVNVLGMSSVRITRLSGSGVKYEILVSRSESPEAATESPVTMTSATQTITNLTPNTQYYAYIRAFCSEDIVGEWSSAVEFIPREPPATIPYACDFETDTENAKWTMVNGTQTNQWMIGNSTSSSPSNSLYITNNNSSNSYTMSSSASSVYVWRSLEISSAGNYIVSFKWKGRGEIGYDYLRAFLVPASVTFNAGYTNGITVSNTPSGWIALDGGVQLNNKSDWQVVSRTVALDAGEYKLVFYWRNDSSGGYAPPAAVDDIVVEEPCSVTASFNANVLGSSSVEITRTSGNEGSYGILISTSSDPETATESPVVMTSETQTVTGLIPNTHYYAYIRAICSEYNMGEWSSAVEFTTPDCKVVDLTVTTTSTQATITWTGGTLSTSYQLYISDVEMSDSDLETANVVTLNNTSYTVSNLPILTDYYVYVRSNCGQIGYSDWASEAFYLPLEPKGLPYNENFESGTIENWIVKGGVNKWYVGQGTSSGGSYSLYISDNNGGDNHYNTDSVSESFAFCSLNIGTPSIVNITFDWKCVGDFSSWGSYYDYLRVFLVPVSLKPSFTNEVMYNSYTPSGWINVNGTLCNNNSWSTVSEQFILTEEKYYLAFYWKNDGGYGSQPPAAIDNLHVVSPLSCLYSGDISVSDISKTSATFSWPDGEYVSQWQLLVTTASDPDEATETPIVVADNTSYTVTNLIPETDYHVYLRGYYSATNVGLWNEAEFETLPYCLPVENVVVDSYDRNSVEFSWEDVDGASQWDVLVSTSSDPDLATESPIRVNTPSAMVSGLEENTQYYVYVSAVCSAEHQSPWTDGELFTTWPLCVSSTNIHLSVLSATSARIIWDHPYANIFHVYVSPTTMTESQLDALSSEEYNTVIGNAIKSYYADSLTPNQTYHFYVSADCNDVYGDWEHFQFTTVADESMPLPYYQDFEADLLQNWHLNNDLNGWYDGNAIASTGEKSLYISSDYGETNTYTVGTTSYSYAYCRLRVDQPIVANVSFDWRNNGGTSSDRPYVFMIPVALNPNLSAGVVNFSYYDFPEGWLNVAPEGLYFSESWQESSYDFALRESGEYYLVLVWKNTSSWGHNPPAAIDNISVDIVSTCVYPDNLEVAVVGKNSVTLSFDYEGDATQWEVLVTTAESLEEATEAPVLVNSKTPTIGGLDMQTSYQVYVRTYCSESEQSMWSDDVLYFSTLPPCEPIYELKAFVKPNSADLSWRHPYDVTNYRIVKSETELTDVDLASAEYVEKSGTTYTATSLTPGQTYHIYVTVDCGDNEISDWVHTTFTTPATEALPLPYFEDFEDAVVENWVTSNNTVGWYLGTGTGNNSDWSMYVSMDGGVRNSYCWTSTTDYSYAYCRLRFDQQGVVRVKLDWKCVGWHYHHSVRPFLIPVGLNPSLNAGNSNGMDNTSASPNGWINALDIKFLSEYSVSDGWNWHTNSKDHNILTPGDYYLVFYWSDNNRERDDPPGAIDNISVEYISYCLFEGDISVDNITRNSADISWTSATGSQWQVLVTTADNPDEATESPVLVSTMSYIAENLEANPNYPNSNYNVFVRTYCSESEQSPWSSATSFSTLPPCEPVYGISADVLSTEVYLSWLSPYNYDSFYLYASPTEMTDAEIDAESYFITNTSTDISFSGLEPGLGGCHFYISSGCSDTEHSSWTHFYFETPDNDIQSLPYYQDFESDYIQGWYRRNETNGWSYGSAVSYEGDRSLYVSNDGGGTYGFNISSNSYSLAYFAFNMDSPWGINLSFDWHCNGFQENYHGSTYIEVGMFVYIVPFGENSSFNTGDDFHYTDEWRYLGSFVNSESSTWERFSGNVNSLESGNYYVVFEWYNYYYDATLPAAVDNISVVRLSDANDIVSFAFDGADNVQIDTENHIVTCDVPYSWNLRGVTPQIVVSDLATISPESGAAVNLSYPFVYTVTAESGLVQEWTIMVSRREAVADDEIISFWTEGLFDVTIDSENATVNAILSRMYDITSIVPTIEISPLASIDQVEGRAYDFSRPRVFVVTAENGVDTKSWTINVSYMDSPLGADCSNPYVVDAENDLPYFNSATTEGLYNMINTYYSDRPEFEFELSGNDAVYRVDLQARKLLVLTAHSYSGDFSVLVMNSCGALYSYRIDSKTNESNISFTVDCAAGSSYIIVDTDGVDVSYEIQIDALPHCFVVNDLDVIRLQTELDVAWSSDNVGDSCTLKYGTPGFDVETEGVEINLADTHYEITGLTESTPYDIYVRANCVGSNGNSEWTLLSTSTIAGCQYPEDLTASDVYEDEATLSWQGFNMSQWEVGYKKESDANYTTFTVDESTVTLTGLQLSTTYNVRVRTLCDDENSAYAEIDFTTPCVIIRNFPYTEDFNSETFPPVCWSQERTAVGSGIGINYVNGAWMRATATVDDNSTPKAMLADTKAESVHNLSSTGIKFVENINGYTISLDVYRSTFSSSATDEGVEVWVNTYPDIENGNPQKLGYVSKNYLVSDSDNVSGESSPGWYTYTFNTRGSVGFNYVILVGKSNNAGGVYVDNLTIDKAVDCIAPRNLVVESVGEDNIVLTWTDINAITGTWTVRYSLNGGEVVEATIDEPRLTIGGLQSSTSYSISAEIQGVCAVGMESDWYIATVETTTECQPLDMPYTQDFDVASGELPDCWRTEGDGRDDWSVSNGEAHLVSGNSQVEAHLLSPRFNLTSDARYLLEFDVLQSSQNINRPDTLYVLFVNDGIDTLRSIVIQNASSSGMIRMSINVPQYEGEARFDFVLSGYRECSIDNLLFRQKSAEAEILTFEVPEQTTESVIDSENATISVYVASMSNYMYLTPTFTISENATIDVESGEWRDFSEPVEYIVTAEDGVTSKTWTVTVGIDENYCPNPSADDMYIYAYNDSIVMYIRQVQNETSYNFKISSQPIDPEIETADLFEGIIESDSIGYGWRRSLIEGLDAYTYYYIYVQSNCGANGWTEKTVCGVFTLPYEQDFSDLGCWEIYDYNYDDRTWSVANGEAMYTFSRTNQAYDYLSSPWLRILQNTKLEFKYKAGNFSYPETFLVLVSNGSDIVQLDSLTVNNETYQTYGPVDLSDFAGQNVEIAIVCRSEANRYRLYIDDFKVVVSDYVINVSSVGNGSISPDGIVEVAPGESAEFAIVPDEYNDLLSLTLDGEDVSDEIVDGIYTLADVNAEHTLIATFTERYTFTASAGEGGHIVTDGVTVAERGDTVSFVVIPNVGYRPGDVIVDGVAVQLEQGSYIYTFENVDANHTIHATFDSIIYHTVFVEVGENGVVSPNGSVVIEEGENLTISVMPEEGYIVHEFVVDGENIVEELIANGYNYTFENIIDDHTVYVSFVENVYYTIVVSYGEHGIITPNGDVSVANGYNQTFHIVADAGCHIESVTVDGEEVPSAVAEGVYTFENVTSEHTIHAEFAVNTYTIVTYAQGGTITPSGSITVNHGDTLTFTLEPNEEYELLNFMVDNESQEVEGNTYTLDSISADHTIVVIFTPMDITRHEIIANAGEHGSIMPSGRVRVIDGESQEFQIIPDEHYHISSLFVDGEAVDVADSYLFQDVTADHTISAGFEVNKRIVTIVAGEHGSVTPSGEQEVDEGSDITLTFDPSAGYMVSEVLVDDVSVEFSGDSYTLQNVLEDHVVMVNFDLLPMWTVTAVSGANGTISPSGTQYVLDGDDIEFTFIPNDGYMLDVVVVDGYEFAPESSTYRFENVTENHYIYISFRPLVYFITATAGPHGELSPSGIVEVAPGATQVFTFDPYIGYEIDSVFVDGEYVETDGNTYEFVDVNTNHTFHVTFVHLQITDVDEISMTASLYPNPNDGRFMVDFAGIRGNVVYQLVDAAGAIVDVRDIYVDEGMSMEFHHDLRPGVYFARFVSGDKVQVERFVVK